MEERDSCHIQLPHSQGTIHIRKGLPPGIAVSVASARDGDFDPERWWEKRKSVKLFARELVGMCVTLWEMRRAKADGATQGAELLPEVLVQARV